MSSLPHFLCIMDDVDVFITNQEVDGKYQRSGPETVLVSKHSATGGRCDSDPTAIIQIDANHSNMVKFSPGHHSVTTITHSLREIFENKYQLTEGQFDLSEETGPFVIPHWMDTATMNAVGGLSDHDPTWVPDFWDVNCEFVNSNDSPRQGNC